MWMAKAKFKRLKFCKQLRDHMDAFIYKPGNYGYSLVKQDYKGIFVDC